MTNLAGAMPLGWRWDSPLKDKKPEQSKAIKQQARAAPFTAARRSAITRFNNHFKAMTNVLNDVQNICQTQSTWILAASPA
jgi:hypothetical protein